MTENLESRKRIDRKKNKLSEEVEREIGVRSEGEKVKVKVEWESWEKKWKKKEWKNSEKVGKLEWGNLDKKVRK